MFKTLEEIRDTIGKDQAFAFLFYSDGIAEYKTCLPIIREGYARHYLVKVFIEDFYFSNYESFIMLLNNYKIFEVIELTKEPSLDKDISVNNVLYHKKYTED